MNSVVGTTFGRLTVLSHAEKRYMICVCVCATTKKVRVDHLQTGAITSCGCLNRERVTKHGYSAGKNRLKRPDEYGIWLGLRDRCRNPRNKTYYKYGARGVTVDPAWDDFAVFLADMGPRPSKEHSVDRIDNAKGYGPGNCRWATRREQGRNTRHNRMITANDKTQTLIEWGVETGILPNTIATRLRKGWSPHDAVNTPLLKKRTLSPRRHEWCCGTEREFWPTDRKRKVA